MIQIGIPNIRKWLQGAVKDSIHIGDKSSVVRDGDTRPAAKLNSVQHFPAVPHARSAVHD
jgi:hypothetical protein